MDNRQGLELKQTQKLSPLQIQTIKLIELPIQDLQQRIRRELEENPVLDDDPAPERWEDKENGDDGKDVSIDEIKDDDYIPSYRLKVNNWGKDEKPVYNSFSVKESFTESLMDQLGCRELGEHERSIAVFIIGSLDDDGYLRRDIDSLVDDLAFRAGITATEEEVADMLALIQEFEPAGVGARDLRECLLLQLGRAKQTPDTVNAKRILTDFFEDFSNKHFKKILSRTGMSEDELKAAMARIVKLNPAPGGQIDDSYDDQAQQVVP
ncbi:MAG: RNA polymerase sigma-54 factor, partial [Bacteroidales bacterium]|nr:RNA polymerase sigma-54 factor [Bacteroidales bacterium]